MMRIAIAGSGGLARIFAQCLDSVGTYTVIILSRRPQPALTADGFQVVVVNYDDQTDLRYTLRGIDVVISTVSGSPQINLIDAAAHSGVSRFVPAEFEGPPGRRTPNDPLDRGKKATIARLKEWSHDSRHRMRFTIFSCGVFYQRFARGGLAAYNIGSGTGIRQEGDYLMNLGTSTAEIVEFNAAGQSLYVCLTSVYDLAKFVAAALELGPSTWPAEFRLQSDRRTVSEIVQWGAVVKGLSDLDTIVHQASALPAHLEYHSFHRNWTQLARFQELAATEQGRYNFSQPTLNQLVNVVPEPLWDWLYREWGS
ncbi:hypothetical protein HYALB_00004985 [Hymenoscyphus albidus]|uniref:NAD(P)-binding domain-containing protein n=1 Tax=Hymenoscyphus albidus TaxID=595503 RepID=A0A9N9Q9K0_9HELO|nr:hypothetical protein HYALB_00004985 [Hymenoscyphus albidus]